MNEKAIYGGTFNANDGTYQNDRNPNAYYIQYKILPEPGKEPSYENDLVHQVSFAKIHHHAATLNIINAGSGDLLRNYYLAAKNSIMQFCQMYKSRHFKDIRNGNTYTRLPGLIPDQQLLPSQPPAIVGYKRKRTDARVDP